LIANPEEIAMNAKLIAAVFAALSFASAAHAEQTFGRDSVYAGQSVSAKQSGSAAKVTRQGRDSVYVTNSPAPKSAVKVGNYNFKHGRA
jgi:hypothetical protein